MPEQEEAQGGAQPAVATPVVETPSAPSQEVRDRLNEKYAEHIEPAPEAHEDEPPAEEAVEDQGSGSAAPEQDSVESDQSSGDEGGAAAKGDLLPEDLLQRAKALGLSDAQIKRLGTADAVEAATDYATSRLLALAQSSVPPPAQQAQAQTQPPAKQEQAQQQQAPQGFVLPEGLDELYPELAAPLKGMVSQFDQMQQRLQQQDAYIQQQQQQEVRRFLNSKFESDKVYGEFLKDPKAPQRQEIAVMMDTIAIAAQRAGMNPSPDDLYALAARSVLADKHAEMARKQLEQKLDRTKRKASIRPAGRTFTPVNKTMDEKRNAINAKFGKSSF